MWVSVCFLKRLPGIPGSPGLWTRQRPGGMELLDVAGPGHFAHRDVLGSRESGVDRAAAGESTRELLADRGSYGLEFRDGDELDTDIWDRLYGGMGRISRVARRPGNEFLRCCDLLRACRYCKRPGPEPVGVLSETGIRGQGEADSVGDV